MKFITIFLAFLILSLPVIPCNDGITQCTHDQNEVSEDHDHSEDEKDHCTPFCACSCCGIVYTIPKTNHQLQEQNFIFKPYQFFFQSNYAFKYSDAIWHPPS